MRKTEKLTYTAIIAALTTATSGFIYIPIGFAKIFPIQHFANVLAAVLLGPWYALAQAFISSTLRILMGTGSFFAYPGSMIGAVLAAYLFAKTKKYTFAVIGEVIGTGILGALATYPIGLFLLGKETTLFGLMPAFMMSSFVGAWMAYGLLRVFKKNKVFGGVHIENSINNRRV